jgi:hypothetical protein
MVDARASVKAERANSDEEADIPGKREDEVTVGLRAVLRRSRERYIGIPTNSIGIISTPLSSPEKAGLPHQTASSIWRMVRAMRSAVNGFSMKFTAALKTPCRSTASSV